MISVEKTWWLLLHVSIFFSVQDVVAAGINPFLLQDYTFADTIHVFVQNQVGFTGYPCETLSPPFWGCMKTNVDFSILLVYENNLEWALNIRELNW